MSCKAWSEQSRALGLPALQSVDLRIPQAPSVEPYSYSICAIAEGTEKSLLLARLLPVFPWAFGRIPYIYETHAPWLRTSHSTAAGRKFCSSVLFVFSYSSGDLYRIIPPKIGPCSSDGSEWHKGCAFAKNLLQLDLEKGASVKRYYGFSRETVQKWRRKKITITSHDALIHWRKHIEELKLEITLIMSQPDTS